MCKDGTRRVAIENAGLDKRQTSGSEREVLGEGATATHNEVAVLLSGNEQPELIECFTRARFVLDIADRECPLNGV
ncbi:putative uncharacterized protein [Microcella alkaliphila]|uniref:Uncharacterized protein n=1 Tax=Microcella alkaliphila TaxID=279828 RepID=A0A0U5B6H7_9MICO|nr:putative uncharacterized protein [Microcella alkaliphila]